MMPRMEARQAEMHTSDKDARQVVRPDAVPVSPSSATEEDAETRRAAAVTSSQNSGKKSQPQKWQYRNSLLAVIGYLDLANAMDFPANVWNQVPLPRFAIVLMALGGAIAILTTGFAFWDMHRSKRNIDLLHEERAHLKSKAKQGEQGLSRVERAWLDISFREIGWEYIDRILMDLSMAVAGILVGIGCLLAIRGAIPSIFLTSNILSGYLGNGFVAFYAVVNTPWSIFMWMRGRRHQIAAQKIRYTLGSEVQRHMQLHGHRHQIYAIVNGVTLIVSGVGSLLSAEHWYGYVILIPCIMGSIFCNYYWRYCLGYNRYSIMDRACIEEFDIAERLGIVITIRSAFVVGQAEESDFFSTITAFCKTVPEKRSAVTNFMQDYGLSSKFASHLWMIEGQSDGHPQSDPEVQRNTYAMLFNDREAVNMAIRDADIGTFRDEERFLLELYGCYLCIPNDKPIALPLREGRRETEKSNESEGPTPSSRSLMDGSLAIKEEG